MKMENGNKNKKNKYEANKKENYCLTENNDSKNSNFFLSHKDSMETLLSIIKKAQIDCIINKKLKKDNNSKKEILLKLKEVLNKELDKKSKICNQIWGELKQKKESLKNKINNSENYITDMENIKFINFNIENKIKVIDSMIKEQKQIIENKNNYLKRFHMHSDYKSKKEFKILKITAEKKEKIQQQLINMTIKKSKKEEEIKNIQIQISNLKNKMKSEENSQPEKIKENEKNNDMKIQENNCENSNENSKIIVFQKINEDFFSGKNNSSSESSNKETNFDSVKQFVFDVNNNNYNYLKKKIFFDIDNDKTLNSFNSSMDSNV